MNFWGIFRSWLWSIDVLGEAGVDCGFFLCGRFGGLECVERRKVRCSELACAPNEKISLLNI